ncbi:MAG: hypothetical protein SCALA701_26650 [Candidatus Scalindua sp.]|nr:MAG: hypothetical protein EX341_14340 [Candidatus Scalindua sp. SCAELEC01]GJQ59864.1 MAG: hypothetical protein SCALA701_26650 [Candidatus Scalindua sp.]
MVHLKQMIAIALILFVGVLGFLGSRDGYTDNEGATTGGGVVSDDINEGICDFIGICTTTPEANLHIYTHNEKSSSIRLEGNSKLDGSYREYTTIERTGSALRFIDDDKGEIVTMKENGKVGIGTKNPQYELDVNGTTRTKVIRITGGSDLSEQFAIEKPHNLKDYIKKGEFTIEPGMVASIDTQNPGKLLISNKAYDRTVAGIISGAGGVRPGMLMGQTGSITDGEFPVALTGRVYCKADATGQPIKPGDLLTTSDTPGHVMKVSDYDRAHGATIGKAMSSLDNGKGLVLVLVSLQ